MKVYRLIFTRSSEQQIDIPADKVSRIEPYDNAICVYGEDETLVVAIPMKDFVGCGVIEAPDPTLAKVESTE